MSLWWWLNAPRCHTSFVLRIVLWWSDHFEEQSSSLSVLVSYVWLPWTGTHKSLGKGLFNWEFAENQYKQTKHILGHASWNAWCMAKDVQLRAFQCPISYTMNYIMQYVKLYDTMVCNAFCQEDRIFLYESCIWSCISATNTRIFQQSLHDIGNYFDTFVEMMSL